MNLNERIKLIRKDRKITQRGMAEKLGVNLRTYQKYESGEISPPLGQLQNIADALETDINYLLNGKTLEERAGADEETTTHKPDDRGVIEGLNKLLAAHQEILDELKRLEAFDGSPEMASLANDIRVRIKHKLSGRMLVTLQKDKNTTTYAISVMEADKLQAILKKMEDGWTVIDGDKHDAEVWIPLEEGDDHADET